MSTTDDEGTIIVLLERFRLQRLPAVMEMKSRVDAGEKLSGRDLEFLEQVFEDMRDVQPLVARHPELANIVGQVSSLYKQVTDKALSNEQHG